MPATVQAVLAARIDRLPPEEKRAPSDRRRHRDGGAHAPVTGHCRACLKTTVHRGLAHLQAAEFLYETRLFPEREFTFTHALTHEVAYGSLLPGAAAGAPCPHRRDPRRRSRPTAWPSRANGWPIMLCGASCGPRPWHTADRPGRRPWPGQSTARRQGTSSRRSLPCRTCQRQRATREQAIDLRFALRSALQASGDFGRILILLREAEALAAALDDPRRQGRASLLLSRCVLAHGRL